MKSCTVSDTGRTKQKKNTNIASAIIDVSSLNSSTSYVIVAPCLFTLLLAIYVQKHQVAPRSWFERGVKDSIYVKLEQTTFEQRRWPSTLIITHLQAAAVGLY